MGIFQGIAILIGGPGIPFLPESFTWPGRWTILGIQAPVWFMGLMALASR